MIKLGPRLMALAALLPEFSSCLYDIGCDHAQLPIFMVQTGRCERAVAIDIREGPLARAAANCQREGVQDQVSLLLNDGLRGVRVQASDSIIIAGLGGHEIGDILEGIEAFPGLEILVQVNWHWWVLRERASSLGYLLSTEEIIEDSERLYLVLKLIYSGVPSTTTPLAAYVGPELLSRYREGRASQKELRWLERLYQIASKRACSGRKEDLDILSSLERIKEDADVSARDREVVL